MISLNQLKKLLFAVCLLAPQMLFAQTEMADAMRSDGKIYVVIAVVAVVLLGVLFYIISIDRKLQRMEKLKNKQ